MKSFYKPTLIEGLSCLAALFFMLLNEVMPLRNKMGLSATSESTINGAGFMEVDWFTVIK